MKIKALIVTVLLLTGLSGFENADAQSSDDSAVWSVIESVWQAEQRGDTQWVEDALAADFVGWSNSSPAPRDKGSTRLWNNFSTKQVDMLEHELYPLSIIVHGDTAVAHYLYSSASKAKGQDVEVASGRYTDVLVRVDGAWKFLSWHGGDD
jgi:ketosteroid isomerase-like protein